MDPRRRLIPLALFAGLAGCAPVWPGLAAPSGPTHEDAITPAASPEPAPDVTAPSPANPPPLGARSPPSAAMAARGTGRFASMTPIPNPRPDRRRRRAVALRLDPDLRATIPTGRSAIAAANIAARQTSGARAFLGGVQVFVYDPGRIYEVWTAPLRVTTLTLSRGETVISKAAGDTVRWQIGETQSGEGAEQRTHVMIKPLVRGLETNLVLATSRRVYLLQLRSGDPDAFNAAVTWDLGAVLDAGLPAAPSSEPPPAPALVTPQGPLDAGYRIRAKGRRPAWTPSAVATDGRRTFLSFPAEMAVAQAPALFALGPAGDVQLVNYRQQGALWVVDRVLSAAELRMGGRRPQVVRIERSGAAS